MHGLSLKDGPTPRDAAELRREIARVFADRALPSGTDLTHRDPRYADEEGTRLAAFLRGRDWRTLDLDTFRANYPGDPRVALLFMRGEGVAYYLPAFLCMALDGVAADEWDMPDALTFALTPRDGDESQRPLFAERVRDLRPAERAVVRAVLEYLADAYEAAGNEHNPARRALTAYWGDQG